MRKFDIAKLSEEERLVYKVIEKGKATQRKIADSEEWLGCHPKYEEGIGLANEQETTLRKVRQIIRNLRINHHCPILSDGKGYWITNNEEEIRAFLKKMEKSAISQAKALMKTYREMQKTFSWVNDLKSEFLEAQSEAVTKYEQGTLF